MALKNSSSVPKQIRVAIGKMRRAVQRHFLIDGLKNFLLTLLVLIIVDFALDRTFRMDGPQRLIMLILSVSIKDIYFPDVVDLLASTIELASITL